jgi:hypothetical protein
MTDRFASRLVAMGLRAILVLCPLVGCQRSTGVLVEGTVTYNGRPVEEGSIAFFPAGAGGHAQGAVIKLGQFAAMVQPGSKRVEICGSRPMKPDARYPDLPTPREDFIPAKYNSETVLSAKIRANGENRLEFNLQAPDAPVPR